MKDYPLRALSSVILSVMKAAAERSRRNPRQPAR